MYKDKNIFVSTFMEISLLFSFASKMHFLRSIIHIDFYI